MTCHIVAALHAFRCPTGGSGSVYIRLAVEHGRIVLRVLGLVA